MTTRQQQARQQDPSAGDDPAQTQTRAAEEGRVDDVVPCVGKKRKLNLMWACIIHSGVRQTLYVYIDIIYICTVLISIYIYTNAPSSNFSFSFPLIGELKSTFYSVQDGNTVMYSK